jgi:hypothetical protein
VMVTPGNHDVDRNAIPGDGEIDMLQRRVRAGGTYQERDELLAAILRDASDGERLLAGMAAYNDFASEYGCGIDRTRPHWERDFELSDKSILRFRGITTVLLSSFRDRHDTHKMMYGVAQRTVLRRPNVRYAIVGHHPTSWVIEGEAEAVDQVYSVLTSIQIFGHKHEQWLTTSGNSVRIVAGAVHPSRMEQNWIPRYSALAISAADDRHLALRIFPRRWSTEEITFIGDYNLAGQDYRDYVVEVPAREP